MSAKRIRCACGRVYEPAKHPQCPDCGTPAPQLIAQPPPPPPQPSPAANFQRPPEIRQTAPAPSPPRSPVGNKRIIGAILIAVGLFAIFVLVRQPSAPKKQVAQVEEGASPTAAATASPISTPVPSATKSPTAAPTAAPTAVVILPPSPPPTPAPPQFDLAGAIAHAAPDATIRIPAGLYRGGFVVRQALHLVGDPKNGEPVVLASEGKPALAVEAQGVSVANVQLVSQGIGSVPAISVAKGAALNLDSCKLQSGSALGVSVAQNGMLGAVDSSFSAVKGAAVRLEPGAKGNFTQTGFRSSLVGLSLATAAVAELHGCAFEGNGLNDPDGASADLSGANTRLTAEDCQFMNNSGGINVSDQAGLSLSNSSFKSNGGSYRGIVGLIVICEGGSASLTHDNFEANRSGVLVTRGGKVEMENCSFDQNGFAQSHGVVAGSLPLSVGGEGSTGVVRQSSFARSTPYAVSVIDGGQLTLEGTDISGSAEIGLLVGDRSASGGHAEIKGSHFVGNTTGLGICAKGSAVVEDSEFRENNDGVVVLGAGSELRLTKCKLLKNKRQGLHVFVQATATVADCDLQDNVQGALSGSIGRANERAAITFEDCRFGANHVFGAGAGRESELVLNNCTFDGTDKSNIYKDRGAKVRVNSPAGESPSPASEEETPNEKKPHHHATPKPHVPSADDIKRTLRKLLPGGG